MKKTNLFAAALIISLLQPAPVEAQEYVESRTFLNDVRDMAVLYRSNQARKYNFTYDGTYFWDSEFFEPGGVMLDGRWYEGVLVNVDAYGQNVFIKSAETRVALTPDRDHVDYVTMGGKRFVNLRRKGYPDLPEGYFEVVHETPDYTVFLRKDKLVVSDLSMGSSGGGIILDKFETRQSYYMEKDGRVTPMRKGRTRRYLESPGDRNFLSAVKSARQSVGLAGSAAPVELIPAVPDSLRASAPLSALKPGDFKVGDRTIYSSLPAGFFSTGQESADDGLLRLLNAGNEMVTFANKVYEIGSPEHSRGDRAVVRGTVRDVLTGEPLIGVAVFDGTGKAYAMTDNSGAYQISLPLGENTLGFSGYSLDDLHLNVMAYSDGGLDVVMKEKITSLKGAVVSAESMVKHRDSRMGIEKVRINTIQKVPSAFGESDVLKVVLTLPGVKSVGEASSGFNVRGGSTDQNLVLFNDGTIYNPSHLFGVFSAFNTDVINDIELYKSSIPAEFGGRISSVLDVRGREGNSNKVQGSLGLGLLTSRFHVEGPIGERTTFIAGGRTTYSNWLFNFIPEGSAYNGGTASFSDLNVSVTTRINDRNTLHAYGYWSRDKFSFDGDTTFRYSNLNASLKWRSTVSDRTSVTTVAGYDDYSNIVENEFNEMSGYNLETGIGQEYLKSTFKTVINDRHTVSYGLQGILYDLNPGVMTPLQEHSYIDFQALDRMTSVETAAFLSDTWKPGEKLSLDLGLRYSGYFATAPTRKFYGAPEIRASAKYSFRENLSLKAGFNSMNQYIHLISNTASVSPMDAWHLADANLKPQNGWQAASGLYWTVDDNKIDLSVEAYYKHVENYLDYKSGAVLIMNPNLADDLVTTYGRAYGIEFMARKDLGKLNGWVSYTYSRSFLREMEDHGVESINHGEWYCAPHDKPHDFKIVGNYKFTHRYSLSFNVDYSTGRPVTIPVAGYYYGGGLRLAYSYRNGYRIPDYFRLDLALNIDPGHYLRKLTHMSWTVGVYNVTGRKNAYSVYFNSAGSALNGYKISVFAAPIPYINLNLKFG